MSDFTSAFNARIPVGLPQDLAGGPLLDDYYDFTLAFEQIVFTLIPAILFILCTPYYLIKLIIQSQVVDSSLLVWIRVMLSVMVFSMTSTCNTAWSQNEALDSQLSTVTGNISTVFSICLFVAVWIEHLYNTRPSRQLSAFIALTALFDLCKVRSYYLRELHTLTGFTVVIMWFKLLVIILDEVSKEPHLLKGVSFEPDGLESMNGPWDWALLRWINPKFLFGYHASLQVDDLHFLDPELQSTPLILQFQKNWDKAHKKGWYSPLWTFLETVGPGHLFAGVFARSLQAVFMFVQPFIIGRVVEMAMEPTASDFYANSAVWAAALSYLLMGICRGIFRQVMARNEIMMRACYTSAIFEKMLRLPQSVLERSPVTTLITDDIAGCQRYVSQLIDFIVSIACLFAGTAYLAFYVGFAVVLLVLPISGTIVAGTIYASQLHDSMKDWDKAAAIRLGSTTAMLRSMKSLRNSGIIQAWLDRIDGFMADEIDSSKTNRIDRAALFSIEMASNAAIPTMAIASGVIWLKNDMEMSPSQFFGTLAVALLITDSLASYIHSMPLLGTQLDCTERIQDFLIRDGEVGDLRDDPSTATDVPLYPPPRSTRRSTTPVATSHEAVEAAYLIDTCTLPGCYDGRQVFTYTNVIFPKGKTTMIIGRPETGKSTLLNILTGETQTTTGRVVIDADEVSYCSQKQWLENRSVRENIVGSMTFNQYDYDRAVVTCCLVEDFALLSEGDATIAGPGGCNLSNSQKHRILLARCLYRKTKIVVLDNIFTSLHRGMAARIFANLFQRQGCLAKSDATIIMVTNIVEHLKWADQVLYLEGRADVERVSDLTRFIKENTFMISMDDLLSEGEPTPQQKMGCSLEDIPEQKQSSPVEDLVAQPPNASTDLDGSKASTKETPMKHQREKLGVHQYYLATFDWPIVVRWIICTALSGLLVKVPNIFLRILLERDSANGLLSIGGYALFSLAGMAASAVTIMYFLEHMIAPPCRRLHQKLLDTTLQMSAMCFFNTDVSTLIDRFSRDISIISKDLPISCVYSAELVFMVVVDIAIILSGMNVSIALLPIAIAFLYLLQKRYASSSRQMRLLQLEASGRVFNFLDDISAGIDQIRAHQEVDIFQERFESRLDYYLRPFYESCTIQQSLHMMLDIAVTGAASLLISSGLKSIISTSPVGTGLVMLNLLALTQTITRLCDSFIETETALDAVARVQNFEEQTPVEDDVVFGSDKLTADWPDKGKIEFQNVSVRYNPSSKTSAKMLKNVSLNIEAGENTSMVGPTGSGKSALLMTLLNMLPYEGTILIDNVDIRSVPNQVLRSKITSIAQTTFRLPGTVRFNLYPYEDRDQVQDATMIEVLKKLQLWEEFGRKSALDTHMNMTRLSPGSCQAFSLARGIIHHLQTNSKIILMDQATNKMDADTAKIARLAMQEYFQDCTKIRVMGGSEEYTTPLDLVVKLTNGAAQIVKRFVKPEGGLMYMDITPDSPSSEEGEF